jgi:hypothetical protein
MRRIWLMLSAAGLLAAATQGALAIDDYGGPFPRVGPVAGPGIPTVGQVPGKEYAYMSVNYTVDAQGAPYGAPDDPGQTQVFDGFGGDADGIDFVGAGTLNVDAMASFSDALFPAVVSNTAALLISQTGDVVSSAVIPIKSESISGTPATWATWAEVDAEGAAFGTGGPPMPGEFEGLEVWGADGAAGADTSRVSFGADAVTGTSVFHWTGAAVVPYISQATIVGILTGLGYDGTDPTEVDVDALMTFDDGDGVLEPGDFFMFSVRPTFTGTVDFDGGEIIWGSLGSGFGYLFHGGHLWDTAFDVAGTFGGLENVDGLEAVATPEPSAMALAVCGCMGLLAFRRRR